MGTIASIETIALKDPGEAFAWEFGGLAEGGDHG